MKKTKWLVIILLLICILPSCTRREKVLASLGSYESEAFYTSGGIQDFTDYAKYQYKSVDLQNNKYFFNVENKANCNCLPTAERCGKDSCTVIFGGFCVRFLIYKSRGFCK